MSVPGDPRQRTGAPKLGTAETIGILGSILQTAATIAGISVALLTTLEALPDIIGGRLNLTSEVTGFIGWAAALSLVACSFSLKELWKGARRDRNGLVEWSIALLFWGMALLGIGLFLLTVPEALKVSELLRRLR